MRALFAILAVVIVWPNAVKTTFAHCATMNGPVVSEARVALEKGEVTPILMWVKPQYEVEVKAPFPQTVTVRAKGPKAKNLVDQ